MKIESVLRMINKRILEYHSYFGTYSFEYGYAKNLLASAVKDYADVESMIRVKDGVWQISRSKSTISDLYDMDALSENLMDVWDKLKEFGTVKSLRAQYLDDEFSSEDPETEYDIMDEDEIQAEIQTISAEAARAVFNDDDYYKWIQGEVNSATGENADYVDYIYNKLFKKKGKGVLKDTKWQQIKEAIEKYKDGDEDYFRGKLGL